MPSDHDRYRPGPLLGRGGFGQVHQAWDAHLFRRVARKTLIPALRDDPTEHAIFLAEARLTAQLQHPGIVSLFELEAEPPLAFTMDEVVGSSFEEVIAARDGEAPDPGVLHQGVEVVARACDAVAYAHAMGVVHRDLKPANIMVGSFGRVVVLDWGGARVLPESPLQGVDVLRDADEADVTGTPRYMSPEVARGQRAEATTDVYGLGAVLYATLAGRAPYAALPVEGVVHALRRGEPPEPLPLEGIPFELRTVVRRAMSTDPRDRYANAGELSAALDGYLQGSLRRDRARAQVEEVERHRAARAETRSRAAALRAEAEVQLAAVPLAAPEQEKLAGWALESEAEALELACTLGEVDDELALHAALNLDPDNAEAHLALAERYFEALVQARRERDRTAIAVAEARMRHHVDAMPRRHAGRRALLARFAPRSVRIDCAVPATAELQRFVERNRRLVPEPVRELGPTPVTVELEPGAWQIVLRDGSGRVLNLPVSPGSREPFVPPGQEAPVAHPFPEPSPEVAHVPAGWFVCGGDPGCDDSLPRAEVWLDAFEMSVFPVTNAEYITFLDDLVARGREAEALRHAPRERAGSSTELGALVYGRDAEGRFHCQADADGDVWLDDHPVLLVDWFGAEAYARWRAERDGLPWRLPTELEWEKAARGPDERLYPWGDRFDPAWCCMRDSHVGRRAVPVVDSYPTDVSPYGVRGLAGGVRDWCVDGYLAGGAPLEDGRPVYTEAGADMPRIERGGAWYGFARDSRAANRFATHPSARFHNMGFRLCRTTAGRCP